MSAPPKLPGLPGEGWKSSGPARQQQQSRESLSVLGLESSTAKVVSVSSRARLQPSSSSADVSARLQGGGLWNGCTSLLG
eukprot:scaffold1342_cov204-Pinguiococcus_pyrenoidosus.AAC.1